MNVVARAAVSSILAAGLFAGCGLVPGSAGIAPGMRECIGLPMAKCEAIVADAARERRLDVSGFSVRCTASPLACTDESGEADLAIRWADGTTMTTRIGWASPIGVPGGPGAIPVPTPPVPPTCLGVPRSQCEEWWVTAGQDVPADQVAAIVSVVVECTRTCTDTAGEGRTIVTFRDGSRAPQISWTYTTGSP